MFYNALLNEIRHLYFDNYVPHILSVAVCFSKYGKFVPFIILFLALFKFRFLLFSKSLYPWWYSFTSSLWLSLYSLCLSFLFVLSYHCLIFSSFNGLWYFCIIWEFFLPHSDLHLLCSVYENLPASKVLVYYDKGNSQPSLTYNFLFHIYSLNILYTVVKCFSTCKDFIFHSWIMCLIMATC